MNRLLIPVVTLLLLIGSFSTGAAQTASVFATGLDNPFDMVIDSTNTTMYVSGQGTGSVKKVDMGTAVVTPILSGTGGYGIALNPAENTAYIGDGGSIQKIALPAGTRSDFIPSGTFRNAFSFVFDRSGANMYVADRRNNRIAKVTVPGGVVTTFLDLGTGKEPYAIVFDKNFENLYVGNIAGKEIIKVSVPGAQITTIVPSTNDPQIGPAGLALDASGSTLYASTFAGNLYKVVISTGTASLFTAANSISGFNSLGGMTMDKHGNLYVADLFNNTIYRIPTVATGVSDGSRLSPQSYVMGQNYPNPFNPSTTIDFTVPVTSHVTLEVLNVLGQRVALLEHGEVAPGTYHKSWSGNGASGVYFYRLQAVGVNDAGVRYNEMKKMTLMK